LPRTPGSDMVDPLIKAMLECELVECELWAPQLEPQFDSGARGRRGQPPPPEAVKAREDLRKWRLETPLDHFREIGTRFKKNGITIYAYNYSPNASYTDAEIDRGFEMTKALGAEIITASTTIEVAKRIAPRAEKHKMAVAMRGHPNTTAPGEFASRESFAEAMKISQYVQ